MWKVLIHIRFLIPSLLLGLIILIIPQLNNSELMDSTQSSKAFGFLWGMLFYVPISLILGIINSKSIILRISIIDILLGLYSLIVIISYWLHPVDHLHMLTFGALVLFYVSIRFINPRYYILLLGAVVISGLIQVIYGNLQLYGVYPSNPGIFKMTGSFFNPGPYAGYLAAIFPISLGLYLYKDTISISEKYPFILKWHSLNNIFIKKISIICFNFCTLYKKDIGRSTPEEQAKKLSHALNSAISLVVLVSMITICLVLPASRSRAAWLAILASTGYLFAAKYNLLLYIRSTFNTVKKQLLLIISVVIILSITGAVLYYFKKDSADGRFLIWNITGEMIKDKPLLGHGSGKFEANYMDYQAAYFKPNPDMPVAMLADNVTYPYNEFLKTMVEHGIIGLLLVLIILGCCFFVKSRLCENSVDNILALISTGGLASVIVFAMFSYPSDILPIKMLLVIFLALMANFKIIISTFEIRMKVTSPLTMYKSELTVNIIIVFMMIFALVAFFPVSKFIFQQNKAYKSWKDASDIYNAGAYVECLEDFEQAYLCFKTNGDFLLQYGKALEIAGKYERSIEIIDQAKGYLKNTILYTCLGNNYEHLDNYYEAEQAYMHAWNMTPARFYPLYLMAKLYDKTGQKDKAVAMAKKIMKKEIKVESIAIEEIKEEMIKIIEKSQFDLQDENDIHSDKNLDPLYKKKKEEICHSVVLTDRFMLQKW